MGDLIEFPTRTVREWGNIQNILRSSLTEAGAPAEMQDVVVDRLKEFFKLCDMNFKVSFHLQGKLPQEELEALALSIRGGFADFEKQLQDFTNNILLERLRLEIELYNLRN